MIKTSISAIIVFSVLVTAIFFYLADGLSEGLCGNEVYKEYLSPNRLHKAVIFQRDCGATTGFTTQISIIEANKNLENKAGNIFVIKGEPQMVAPKIEWESDEQLTIHYLTNGTELRAKTHLNSNTPIKIVYID